MTRTSYYSKKKKPAVHGLPLTQAAMGGFFIIGSVQIGGYAWFVFDSLMVLVNSFLHVFRLYLPCNQRKEE